MHSRIVELSNEPILVDERLSEDSIPEWFYHTVADYTNADTDRGQDIKWFLEHVGGIVDVAENGLSFSFKPNAKQKLILKAKTASEVKHASEPPKPDYSHGTWREDPFSLPEEELALWAIVSPNNMLIPPAQERYMDLFTRVFGITREQLTNDLLPDVKREVQ